MKISQLIQKLNGVKDKEGDILVTIHCDQELSADGKPECEMISHIIWEPEPKRIMLCDAHTFSELSL